MCWSHHVCQVSEKVFLELRSFFENINLKHMWMAEAFLAITSAICFQSYKAFTCNIHCTYENKYLRKIFTAKISQNRYIGNFVNRGVPSVFVLDKVKWNMDWIIIWAPSQYKDCLSRYRDFHYKDKLVVRLSYLHNGNPYTGKMASLYLDGPLIIWH